MNIILSMIQRIYVIEFSGETGNHLLKDSYSISDKIQYHIEQKGCCIVSFNNMSSTQSRQETVIFIQTSHQYNTALLGTIVHQETVCQPYSKS